MNHLEYYKNHGISPVKYNGTKQEHFERRASLYRSLRLPPLAFNGARVLEVAAGTGQNAEYIDSLCPCNLTLIEPNSINWNHPGLCKCTFEEWYDPERSSFEIVICENWLGKSDYERNLLKQIANCVSIGGVLVITCISTVGIKPNLLRRQLAKKLINDAMSFEEKTEILVSAFSSHLETIVDMTRSNKDWVQDVLLNPAYENVALTPAMVFHDLPDFEILGCSPEFTQDWRWFKSLYGAKRRFNEHFMSEFIWNSRHFASYVNEDPELGLEEAQGLLMQENITVKDVANMRKFRTLFGRETIYLSLQRCQ